MPFTVSAIFEQNQSTKKLKEIFDFPERNFQVGKYLELQFEFRTSEMNGMILSIAEPVGFPALSIELHKGKVSDIF